MESQSKFRFSLANIMLMMLPLAVAFWLARQSSRGEPWVVWVGTLLIALGPAIGALLGGWAGMLTGFGRIIVVYIDALIFIGAIFLLAILLQGAIGHAPQSLQAWSVCIVISMIGVGAVVGAMAGNWKGVQGWVVGLSLVLVLCLALVLLIGVARILNEHFVGH